MTSGTFSDFFVPLPLSAFSRNLPYCICFLGTPPVQTSYVHAPWGENMIAFSPLEQEIKPSEERRGEGRGGRRGNKLSLSVTAEFLANANTKTIPIVVVEAVTKNSFPVRVETL